MANLIVVVYQKGASAPNLRFKYTSNSETLVKVTAFGPDLLDVIVNEKPMRLIFTDSFQRFVDPLKNLAPKLSEEMTFEGTETMFVTPAGDTLDLMLTDLEMVRDYVNGIIAREREEVDKLAASGIDLSDDDDEEETAKKSAYPGASSSPVFARLASFAELGAENEYVKTVASFLAAPEKPFQLRNAVIKGYPDFFHAVARKVDQELPPESKAYLRYRAVMDDAWLGQDSRGFLLSSIKKSETNENVFYSEEWLKAIKDGTVSPTYDDGVINEIRAFYRNRNKKKPINTEEIYRDEVVAKLGADGMFQKEIMEVFTPMIKMVIGRRGDQFPFLTEDMLPSNLPQAITTKESLQMEVNEILKLDPQIFVKRCYEDLKTIVENDIPPYFIIVPAKGKFGMAWDVSHKASRRRSRGRVAIPLIPTRDLKTAVMAALAHYRWEAGRDAVFDWTAEGLTGAYYNYYQTEKKKSSDESNIKKDFNERDNFILEYVNWLTYESRGVQKLNRTVREIMWRYVPFADEIKQKLGREIPQVYGELLKRDENRAKSQGS